MGVRNRTVTRLQQLELDHAQYDEGTMEDLRNSDALTADQSQMQKGYLTKVLLAISSISLGTVASYWAFSPPAAIIGFINADIGPSDNASLFAIIWSTCAAIGIILFGRLSDKFGRRYWVLGASIIGFIGGVIACTAHNMNQLVGANVLLGLSGGVHTCYALTIGEICPNKYKLVGVSLGVVPSVLPTGFGAYLAVRLTHYSSWRWIYYSYLIMIAVAITLQFFFYHPPSFQQLHGGKRTIMDEVKRVDFVGIFLLVSGMALFLLGVSWGGQPLSWTSGRILGLLVVGGVTTIVFVFWEIYSKTPNPLVPMHFFKDIRGFCMLNVICIVSGVMYVALSIIWPSQVAAIYGSQSTGWESNAWLGTTIAFGIWGGIVIFGPLVHIIKHIRIQTIVFSVVITVFLGALSTANAGNRAQSAAFSFISTLPAGILELIPVTLVQLDANDADLGTVFAIIFLMRTAWGSIFTTVFLAILTAKIPIEIASHVPAAVTAVGLPASSLTGLFAAVANGTPAALEAVPGFNAEVGTALASSLSASYAAAYAYVYYAAVAVGCCGIIAACCMKDYDDLLTTHISRQIYHKGEGVTGPVDEKLGDLEQGSDSGHNIESTKTDAEHRETVSNAST